MSKRQVQKNRRRPVRARRRNVSRSQAIFSVLALATVCSLVAGALGAAAVLDIFDRDDSELTVDPNEENDPIEREFREDVAANPNDPDAVARLANYLSQDGQLDEGLRLYEQAVSMRPDDPTLRLEFAYSLSDAGSYRDAELQFQRVLEAQPVNVSALLGLARLYRDWSPPRTDEAISLYQQIIAIEGESFIGQNARNELQALGVVVSPIASPASASPVTGP